MAARPRLASLAEVRRSLGLSNIQKAWNLAHRRAREGHLPALHQWAEMCALAVTRLADPKLYFSAGLYRRDLPWARKREFVGGLRARLDRRKINRPQYRVLAEDKTIMAALLRAYGIPAPKMYGHLDSSIGKTLDGEPLRSCQDLRQLIQQESIEAMCFKPVLGSGGRGFVKVKLEQTPSGIVVVEHTGASMELDAFWTERLSLTKTEGYLCEGVVDQHPEVGKLNPTSVNTVRVWMQKHPDGSWTMFGALLRMGVGPVAVDNTSAGGIAAPIEVATGALGAALDLSWERRTFTHHPSTGEQIEGSRLPMWDLVPRICQAVCGIYSPYFGLLGLDVALTPHGPVVLEVNVHPDSTHQAVMVRGIAPLLATLREEARPSRRGRRNQQRHGSATRP